MGLMDKANDFLNSEKGEEITDQALQTGADAANKVTGGKYADHIAHGQHMADERLGMPNAGMRAPDVRTDDQGLAADAAEPTA